MPAPGLPKLPFNKSKFIESTTFSNLDGAQNTKFINSLELCNCSASLTVSQFDTMQDDTLLHNLTIEETPEGLEEFDNSIVPRIVLFETEDGRKGAIKVKEFFENGLNSYILVDIKIQKNN